MSKISMTKEEVCERLCNMVGNDPYNGFAFGYAKGYQYGKGLTHGIIAGGVISCAGVWAMYGISLLKEKYLERQAIEDREILIKLMNKEES